MLPAGRQLFFALFSVTLCRTGCDRLDWKAMVFGAVIVQFAREFFTE